MPNNASQQESGSKEGRCINTFYLTDEYLPKNKYYARQKVRASGRPRLLVIPELCGSRPSPCTYIRILTPLMSPEIQMQFEVRITELDTVSTIAADVILINRVPCEYAAELEGVLEYMSRTGARLVYDIDDQLLDLPDNHPEAAVYKDRQAVVSKLLSNADLVWSSTTFLSEALSPLCKQVETFENYLDLCFLVEPRERSTRSRTSGDKFNILYMGTITHAADLNIVLDALNKLYSEGVEFELHLAGVTTSAPKYSWIKVIHPPESAKSYPEFMRWLRSNQTFDLGIAPLESTRFNRCKSPIKYWDYTSFNIPTLASNVEAYNSAIVDGETGYLANNNTDAWVEELRKAMKDSDQRISMVVNARNTLRKIYYLLNGARRRKKSLLNILNTSVSENKDQENISLSHTPSREEIAEAFLSGDGIEIGALHNPLTLPECAKAKYVDRMPKDQLYEHYPELRDYSLVDVDIIDDGESLKTVIDSSQDFVIANHFLEHSEDPIITITNLLRVTRPGGIVYLAVPNMIKTFDCNREKTSLSHVIEDHKLGVETSRRRHYEEWVALVEPHFGRSYDEVAFKKRVDELMGQKYSIHFHCWDVNGFKEFLQYVNSNFDLSFDISLFVERDDEYISILKKRGGESTKS